MTPFRVLARPLLLLVLAAASATAVQTQKNKKTPPSLNELEAALERDPGNPDLHVSLSLAY